MAFGDIDVEIVAVPHVGDDGDVNLGDTTDEEGGAAAGAKLLTPIGFYGLPDQPSAGGRAARAVMLTIGNTRFAIAAKDDRPLVSLPAPMAPGDRAILSSCAARLELRRAANKIGLYAAPDAKVEIDGTAEQIEARQGSTKALLTALGGALSWDAGAGTNSYVVAAPNGTSLTYTAAGVTCSVVLGPGGRVDITAPGGVFVNGIPLTVP